MITHVFAEILKENETSVQAEIANHGFRQGQKGNSNTRSQIQFASTLKSGGDRHEKARTTTRTGNTHRYRGRLTAHQ
jgi:hypothetical protein